MFVATLTNPYMFTTWGLPAYLDGFAYAGAVQLQEVETVWPATANGETKQKTVFESLETQGQIID